MRKFLGEAATRLGSVTPLTPRALWHTETHAGSGLNPRANRSVRELMVASEEHELSFWLLFHS